MVRVQAQPCFEPIYVHQIIDIIWPDRRKDGALVVPLWYTKDERTITFAHEATLCLAGAGPPTDRTIGAHDGRNIGLEDLAQVQGVLSCVCMAWEAEDRVHAVPRELEVFELRQELDEFTLRWRTRKAAEIAHCFGEAKALADNGSQSICAKVAVVHAEIDPIALSEHCGRIRRGYRLLDACLRRMPLGGVRGLVAVGACDAVLRIEGVELVPLAVTVNQQNLHATNAH
mmetsp:Transcript_27442/g.68881  ORF Transcript_27442/g.68881 Transcript_27442/m.68881 type:complete len:229 (+) Transcript_27442:253-939(+)